MLCYLFYIEKKEQEKKGREGGKKSLEKQFCILNTWNLNIAVAEIDEEWE